MRRKAKASHYNLSNGGQSTPSTRALRVAVARAAAARVVAVARAAVRAIVARVAAAWSVVTRRGVGSGGDGAVVVRCRRRWLLLAAAGCCWRLLAAAAAVPIRRGEGAPCPHRRKETRPTRHA